MDAYHKMLLKIYEASGGRESVDVDFVEIVKREGFFPSIDEISSYLKAESWVTESRQNVLRLTHWGIAEVRKAQSGSEGGERAFAVEKEKLVALARSLSRLADGLDEKNVAEDLKELLQINSEVAEAAARLRKELPR